MKALRVVVADDSALLRRGIASLLRAEGLDVVGEARDSPQLLELVRTCNPDLAIIDIRMPPTFTVEGIWAAGTIQESHPQVGILLLSQYVETEHVMTLLRNGAKGLGYLLKERVTDIDEFISALHRIASGGSAIDPELVSLLVSRPHRGHLPLDDLTGREKEVLTLMAEGKSNQAIGKTLYLGERTVEAHVRSIFFKFGMPPEPETHRRVLAVLTYLRSTRKNSQEPGITEL